MGLSERETNPIFARAVIDSQADKAKQAMGTLGCVGGALSVGFLLATGAATAAGIWFVPWAVASMFVGAVVGGGGVYALGTVLLVRRLGAPIFVLRVAGCLVPLLAIAVGAIVTAVLYRQLFGVP